MACPTIHSFHANPDPVANPLSQFHNIVVQLNLSQSDAEEMQQAYLEDDTPVHGVPLSSVYKVVTSHPAATAVAPLERKRIETWTNKRGSLPCPLRTVEDSYCLPQPRPQWSSTQTTAMT